MTRLKTNIIASFAGQASANIIQLAITPVYIRSLGIEAYGLVGFQLALLTLSQVLDFGISPTVNRELARHSALSREAGEARDFVRTLEVGYWLIGCAIGLAVFGAAPYLSTHWLQRSSLSVATVEESIRIMAILIAAQWPLSFYQSGLLGLQRHRSLNVVRVATTAAAAIGGYIVVVRMPSVTAFFWWQTAMHLLHVGIVAGMLWHWLPGSVRRPRIRLAAIRHTGRFVAGMTVITITSLILTQLDRLVLSRLVSLEQFGYFAVAAIMGYGVSAIARPIFMSIFPKFSALVASHDESAVDSLYRKSWQLMMIVVVPLAAVIAVFSGELLLVWTGNPLVAQAAGPIATILAIGSTVNGLMNIPFALQLAHGWTRLSARVNLLLVLVAVPGIVFAATRYGTLGASAIWPAINIVNMLVVIPVIHRRFLPGIGASWFLREVGGPVAVSVLIALLCRLALVGPNDRRWMVAAIVVAWLSAQMSLMLSSATLRQASKRWTVILANYARTRFSEARV